MLIARSKTVTEMASLLSPIQASHSVGLAKSGDGMTVVTAGLNTFSPAHVCACVCGRVRTCIHSKHTVTTVTTVTQQGKFPVTVAVTVSCIASLLSPTALAGKEVCHER